MSPPSSDGRPRVRYGVALLPLLALFAGIRVLAWRRTSLFDDTDSVGLIQQAQVYLSGNLGRIAALDPDRTPFYPAVAALLALPGWSPEFAARLTSFVFALVLFVALALLIRPLGERRGTLVGLFFVSLSPVLIPYGFAVLTEPTYTAIVYVGLLLFLRQYAHPTPGSAAALGLTFGSAFLCRTEGLLYLGTIPVLQAVHLRFGAAPGYDRRRFAVWAAAYCAVFALLAAPQIGDVSRKMNGFAINGRQAWSLVLGESLTGTARNARRAGLDYSPSEINVRAAWTDPELRARLVSHRGPLAYARIALTNLDRFDHVLLGRMAGPILLICFGYGMLALVRRGRGFVAFAITAFIAAALLAPMLQHLLPRHVIVVLPVIFLVAGLGTVELARAFRPETAGRARLVGAGIVASVCAVWLVTEIIDIRTVLRPPTYNNEYNPAELREPARLVRAETRDTGIELRIVARRPYLAYFAGGQTVDVPFTTLPRLLRYLALNDADFLFLEQSQVAAFPFMTELAARDSVPGLRRLYSKLTETNGRLELYRVEMAAGDTTALLSAPADESGARTRRRYRGSAHGRTRAVSRGRGSRPPPRGR